MKKHISVFCILCIVFSIFGGLTLVSGAEAAIVTADEGWTNATYDAATGYLTDLDTGVVLQVSGASIKGCVTDAEKVVIPSSYNGNPITTIDAQFLFGNNDAVVKTLIVSEGITTTAFRVFTNAKALETVTLPSTLSNVNTMTFNGCSALVDVNIPDCWTTIPNYTFNACSKLPNVNIGENSKLTTIAGAAFYGCTSLEAMPVKEGITTIEGNAFYNCSTLKQVNIPASVTSIGDGAFAGCTSVASYTVADGNTVYTAQDGILYNADKTKMVAYPGASDATSVTIPATLTALPASAFLNTKITSVNFENGSALKELPTSCFEGCKLTSVILPDGLETVGSRAFYNDSTITSIYLPSSVKTIGSTAFQGCSKLADIELPEGLTSLGSAAFSTCSSLKSITIPAGITVIEGSLFNNTGLETVTIKGEVTKINDFGFYRSKNLKDVIFMGSKAPTFGRIPFDSTNLTIWHAPTATGFDTLADYGTPKPFGGNITNVTDDGTQATVEYYVKDVYDNDAVVAYVAAYNSYGDMLAVKSIALDETSAVLDVAGVDCAKIFVWDSASSAKPLYNSVEY